MSYKKCTANIVENWNLDLWGQRVRKVSFSLLGIVPDMWVPSSTDFVCLRVFFSLGSPNFLPPKNQLSKFQSFIFLSLFFSNLIAMLPTGSAWWCSNYHTQQAYWRNFISKIIFFSNISQYIVRLKYIIKYKKINLKIQMATREILPLCMQKNCYKRKIWWEYVPQLTFAVRCT